MSFIILSLLTTQSSFGDDGIWVKGNWAQVNAYCSQTYECVTKNSILHSADTVVRTSDPKIKIGVCNAAGGAIDTCNECSSSPPNEPCVIWIEKK